MSNVPGWITTNAQESNCAIMATISQCLHWIKQALKYLDFITMVSVMKIIPTSTWTVDNRSVPPFPITTYVDGWEGNPLSFCLVISNMTHSDLDHCTIHMILLYPLLLKKKGKLQKRELTWWSQCSTTHHRFQHLVLHTQWRNSGLLSSTWGLEICKNCLVVDQS